MQELIEDIPGQEPSAFEELFAREYRGVVAAPTGLGRSKPIMLATGSTVPPCTGRSVRFALSTAVSIAKTVRAA